MKEKVKVKITKNNLLKFFMIIAGSLIYTLGINFFVVPAGLFNGGFLGLAQVIRTAVKEIFHFDVKFDFSGILSFILNIPLMIFTVKTVGKKFIYKTGFCIALQAVLLSVIPIPTETTLEPIVSCLIGGLMCGFGVGIMLSNGGSSGGMDIIGMYYAMKSHFSVGKISLCLNTVVYILAFAVTRDFKRIIYTLIFAGIFSLALDKMHAQNISSEVLIITKHCDEEIQNAIISEMKRGVSYWSGYGAYTGESSKMLYTVVSKYELPQLKKLVERIDPKAFISVKNGVNITGNFEKRL